jgi:hypothetical protein
MHSHLALTVAQDLPHVVIEAEDIRRDIELRNRNIEQVRLVDGNEGCRYRRV